MSTLYVMYNSLSFILVFTSMLLFDLLTVPHHNPYQTRYTCVSIYCAIIIVLYRERDGVGEGRGGIGIVGDMI